MLEANPGLCNLASLTYPQQSPRSRSSFSQLFSLAAGLAALEIGTVTAVEKQLRDLEAEAAGSLKSVEDEG